jgi:hypothetical protein
MFRSVTRRAIALASKMAGAFVADVADALVDWVELVEAAPAGPAIPAVASHAHTRAFLEKRGCFMAWPAY